MATIRTNFMKIMKMFKTDNLLKPVSEPIRNTMLKKGLKFASVVEYSRVRNKHSRTLINFLTFIQGLRPYSGLHSIR